MHFARRRISEMSEIKFRPRGDADGIQDFSILGTAGADFRKRKRLASPVSEFGLVGFEGHSVGGGTPLPL